MSLSRDGFWKALFWAPAFWAQDFWYETAAPTPTSSGGGSSKRRRGRVGIASGIVIESDATIRQQEEQAILLLTL